MNGIMYISWNRIFKKSYRALILNFIITTNLNQMFKVFTTITNDYKVLEIFQDIWYEYIDVTILKNQDD